MKIEGKKIAGEILEKLKKKNKPNKKMMAVLVGENKASESFIKIKEKIARELEVEFEVIKLDETVSEEEIKAELDRLASKKQVGGIVLQLPLPEGIKKEVVLEALPIEKDVDVLRAKTWMNRGDSKQILPPPVGVVTEILKQKNINLKEQRVAVVGAGWLVGRPVASYLAGRVQELVIFEEGSDLDKLKGYNLIISGVGKRNLIRPEFLSEGTGVIDFGYDGGRGDLDMSQTEDLEKLDFWTPTPGGTGPILVAKLFQNFWELIK